MADVDRTNAPPGPIFSDSDIDRAIGALDTLLQEYDWRQGDNYLNDPAIVRALRAQGITLALIRELFRQLVEQKVFRPWSKTYPAGHSREPGCPLPVFRTEPETVYCLVTTRERWYTFLAEWKERHQARKPSHRAKSAVPQTKSRSPDGTEPYRRGPEKKAERTARRNALIAQALANGIVDEEEIYNFVRQEDPSLLLKNKKTNELISRVSMMRVYHRSSPR
jgi:hypothetical protein